MALDRQPYPAFPGKEGSLGEAVVGPMGLLSFLEDQLGLSAPSSAQVVRIAQWRSKMAAASELTPRFWDASYRLDPWSTAELILSWRDTLREAGWSGDLLRGAPPRLADIAASEAAGDETLPGKSDRLQSVIRCVEAGDPVGVGKLELVDHRSVLPPGWRKLATALEAAGVEITEACRDEESSTGSDLHRIKAFLSSGESQVMSGDGSFAEVHAATSLLASELLADWLANDAGAEPTVIVTPDGDTTLLDLAFAARGLPALGASPSSPHRGTLQLVGLAFATRWAPFDTGKLLEFLSLLVSPIPAWAGRRLAESVAREPGRGGPLQEEAWAKIGAMLEKHAEERGEKAAVEDQLGQWKYWIGGDDFDPVQGMPKAAALNICTRIEAWASKADAGERDPLMVCAAGLAADLRLAIQVLGLPHLPRYLLERMITQAVGDGVPNPHHIAQAGVIRSTGSPGAVWGPAGSVVWWNFAGGMSQPKFSWSEAEAQALEEAGCCPERPSAAAKRQTLEWQRAILNAGSKVLLIRAARDKGEPTVSHPFSHQLSKAFASADDRDKIIFNAEDILSRDSSSLAGRRLGRDAKAPLALPLSKPDWTVSLDPARVAARTESASSFEDLVACQFRWVLKHLARIRPGSTSQLPNSGQLLGNLAHKLAEIVFEPGSVPDPLEVRRRVDEEIEPLIKQMAAPLLQPGYSADLADARRSVPDALVTLAEILASRNIAVQELELKKTFEFENGLQVLGYIDMVVALPDGSAGVIDLKWTRSPRKHRSLLAEGTAIQLATYGRLIDPGREVPSGYYLLNQRRLIALEGVPFASEPVTGKRTLSETWDALIESWKGYGGALAQGAVVATGIEGAVDHLPQAIPFAIDKEVCLYCDYKTLCQVRLKKKAW